MDRNQNHKISELSSPGAIDHVVILVADMDRAIQTWQHELGFSLSHVVDLEDVGIRQAFFSLQDNTFIELVSPSRENSPLSGLLRDKGEGLHVLALRVDDLDAKVTALQGQGVALRGVGTQQVFIEAGAATGVVIQLWPNDRPHRWKANPNGGATRKDE